MYVKIKSEERVIFWKSYDDRMKILNFVWEMLSDLW